ALRQRAALFGHNAPEWDTLDAAIKRRYAPQSIEAVTCVAFRDMTRGDDQGISGGSDGRLRSWNIVTGQALATFSGHRGAVRGVACTVDGKFVISGGDDGTLRVWDAATGGELAAYSEHLGPVLSIAAGQFTKIENINGKNVTNTYTMAVSGGLDTRLLIWDITGGKRLSTITAHQSAISCVAMWVTSEADQLVVSGSVEGSVRVWDARGTSRELIAATTPRPAVTAMALVKVGNEFRLAVGSADGKIKRWKKTGGAAWSIAEPDLVTDGHAEVTALSISAVGDSVLCGAANGALEMWNWSGSAIARLAAAHEGPITAVAFNGTLVDPKILSGAGDASLSVFAVEVSGTVKRFKRLQRLAIRKTESVNEWPGFNLRVNTQHPQIDLDGLYQTLIPGSWIVLARTGYAEVYRVKDVDVHWVSEFSLSSKVTRLILDGGEHLTWFGRRNTTVFTQSEYLPFFADKQPDRSPLFGKAIELSSIVQGLDPGRRVVISGQQMRVKIRENFTSPLISIDGYSQVELIKDDLLTCLSPPMADPVGYRVSGWRAEQGGLVAVVTAPDTVVEPANIVKLRWYLRDRNGFEGYVSTTLEKRDRITYVETQMWVLRPENKDANKISEVAEIARVVEVARLRSQLQFKAPLRNMFDSEFLIINANVAAATHGETVESEVLGSGDGTQTNQRYTLRRTPLSYVAAATASGGESTLEVRVNGVLWKAASSLYELGARDQRYVVRHNDQQQSTIIFGDGVRGTRLPTGQENIRATYRFGIGKDGEVAAGAVKLLVTKPLGIREVINPIAATGAAGPESMDDARRHAPVTVLTLDRIVSLKDYEDFSAAFAGIGKAQASALWTGSAQQVHITAATASGTPIARGSATYNNLVAALATLRDPSVSVQVQGFVLLHFKVKAALRFDPLYRKELVEKAVRSALLNAFSFAQRDFGQAVTQAEVITVMQSVVGVSAVTLKEFGYFDGLTVASTAHTRASDTVSEVELLPTLLAASRARWQLSPPTALPAQLLLLFPTTDGVSIEEMP
ncbi:MAG: putative baseplate assembly protein, partial [Gammaproteobacteria bacterium]|nr:putative baseplate assembly protein [Gammaproteobacteria bacterium]